MKKLLSLLVVLILFSFSSIYGATEGKIDNIYSTTLINGKGSITYSFDVEIPSTSGSWEAKPGDWIEIELKPFWNGTFNDYKFVDTKFNMISGKKIGNNAYYPVINGKTRPMKLRIEGRITDIDLGSILKDVRLTLGQFRGKRGSLHESFAWLPKTIFKNPSALQIKVKSDMDLGSTIPGGTLSTNGKGTVRKGHPAEIYIESSSIQNNDKKVKVSIEKDVTLTKNGGNETINTIVSIRKNGNNLTKELELKEQNGKYRTEVVEIDGLSEKIDSSRHPKGIYEGQLKVRVTYGE